MLKKIILIISLLFAGIVFMFLWVLQDKTKDISEVAPFSEITGRTVTLQRPITLVKNDTGNMPIKDYQMYDAASEYQGMIDNPSIVRIRMKKGTKLKINKAVMRRNVTSGFSHPYVFGTIQLPESGEVAEFDYRWGEQSIEKLLKNVPVRWTFPMAVWETKRNTKVYALPEP